MSEKLRPCPFCGKPATEYTGNYTLRWAWCGNSGCRAFARAELPLDKWNHRPIEDFFEEELREKRKMIIDSAGEIQRLEAVLALKDEEIKALDDVLSNIVLNSRIQPCSEKGGLTDCYCVPLDDIESARSQLAEIRSE